MCYKKGTQRIGPQRRSWLKWFFGAAAFWDAAAFPALNLCFLKVMKDEENEYRRFEKNAWPGRRFFLADVRNKPVFGEGHLPNAVNVPVDGFGFLEKVKERVPGKSAKIVLYCGRLSCKRSPKAFARLKRAGFENVWVFEGGFADWMEAGYEVEVA